MSAEPAQPVDGEGLRKGSRPAEAGRNRDPKEQGSSRGRAFQEEREGERRGRLFCSRLAYPGRRLSDWLVAAERRKERRDWMSEGPDGTGISQPC